MQISQFTFYAGLFMASIASNTTLIPIMTSDRIPHSKWVALFVMGVFSLIGGLFAYMLLGGIAGIGFVMFNAIVFWVISYIIKVRFLKFRSDPVRLGERLLATFRNIDTQICYILSEMSLDPNKDVNSAIQRTMMYILSELGIILGLDNKHHPQMVILLPHDKKFQVLAYSGIPSDKIAKIEATFRYGEESVSLAGEAMNRRKAIIINDLTDGRNNDSAKWIPVLPHEEKKGSILVYPFERGRGENPKEEPVAVLSISSRSENAFIDEELIFQILDYFAPKIEAVQRCWEIANRCGIN